MIEAPPLTLRPWRASDKEALLKYANNRNIWINMRDRFPHPYTEIHANEWLELCQARRGKPVRLAIEFEGEAIGGTGFEAFQDVHCRTAEIGYWVGEPFWGKGFATLALKTTTDYAFANFELDRIQAAVFEWNPASARVLEKAGYSLEGRLRQSVFKDGRSVDSLLYARLRP